MSQVHDRQREFLECHLVFSQRPPGANGVLLSENRTASTTRYAQSKTLTALHTLPWSRAALPSPGVLVPHVWWWPPWAALPAVLPVPPLAASLTNSQGRDPRIAEVLAHLSPVCARCQTARGGDPGTPRASLVATQPGGCLAALLMQTASRAPAQLPVSAGKCGHLALHCPQCT